MVLIIETSVITHLVRQGTFIELHWTKPANLILIIKAPVLSLQGDKLCEGFVDLCGPYISSEPCLP